MTLAVIVLEDEDEVRNAITCDLEPFMEFVRIEPAEDVEDAWTVVAEIDEDDDDLAIIFADHRLPGQTGVDFLIASREDERTRDARTCLITGQADLKDTVRALNEAGLDHYIAKPWEVADLHQTFRRLLTDFVIAEEIDPLPYMQILEQERALTYLRRHGI